MNETNSWGVVSHVIKHLRVVDSGGSLKAKWPSFNLWKNLPLPGPWNSRHVPDIWGSKISWVSLVLSKELSGVIPHTSSSGLAVKASQFSRIRLERVASELQKPERSMIFCDLPGPSTTYPSYPQDQLQEVLFMAFSINQVTKYDSLRARCRPWTVTIPHRQSGWSTTHGPWL